jgi:hypothetical protein
MLIFQTGSHPFPSGPVHQRAVEKETLEAGLGGGVKFIVTLNLLLHLPGAEPDAKPELFHFRIRQFTDGRGTVSCSPTAGMPNMPRQFAEAIFISKFLGETFL